MNTIGNESGTNNDSTDFDQEQLTENNELLNGENLSTELEVAENNTTVENETNPNQPQADI